MGAVLAPAMVSLGGAEFAVGADGSLATAWLLSAVAGARGPCPFPALQAQCAFCSRNGQETKAVVQVSVRRSVAGVVPELTVSAPRLRDARG